MSTPHTLGPWSLIDTRDVRTMRREFIIFPANRSLNAVASAHSPHECFGPKITEAEAEANARLIAAAPDLFAGLHWVLHQLQGDSGTGESYWEQFPQYRAAVAAIAKAEGGK